MVDFIANNFEDVDELNEIRDVYFGFTMAEVLITLGIVGIVASMTMPSIIAKIKDKVFDEQYKKVMTIIANGYKLMMARTSSDYVESLPILTSCSKFENKECMSKEHKKVFSVIADISGSQLNTSNLKLPSEYVIIGNTEKSEFNWEEIPYIFVTTDGFTYGVETGEESTSFDIYADINGEQNPNIVKKDLYKFRFTGEGFLFDVSDELEEIHVCSIDNLFACDASNCPIGQTCTNSGWYGKVRYTDYNKCYCYI